MKVIRLIAKLSFDCTVSYSKLTCLDFLLVYSQKKKKKLCDKTLLPSQRAFPSVLKLSMFELDTRKFLARD